MSNINIVDQIKSKITLSSLVAKNVKLERKGNKYVGLCPFHQEKTSSFTIDDDKGLYHCFGCQASGDVIKYVMDTERYNFQETLLYLSNLAGLDYQPNQFLTNQNSSILTVIELAKNWYISQLRMTNGAKARDYLRSRRVSDTMIDKFQIGFAPSDDKLLINHLSEQKITIDQMIAAGLISSSNGRYYSRFRDRIIFPIFRNDGKVIGFGGRAMGAQLPKYINSPETEIFKKNEILFAENLAKQAIHKYRQVIVVEGYMDVITLFQHGFENSVATMGTAFTDNHLVKLWKLADEPIICLDGDNAGIQAMHKIAKMAVSKLTEGKSLNFVTLPEKMDPDDLINNEGAQSFANLISKSIALSEVLWDIEVSKIKTKTPERMAIIEKNLQNLADSIQNKTVKKFYNNFFKNKIWLLNKNSYNQKKQKEIKDYSFHVPLVNLSVEERYSFMMMAEILSHPILLHNEQIKDNFLLIDFQMQSINDLRSIILDFMMNISNIELINKESLKQHLIDNGFNKEYQFLCGDKSTFIDSISVLDDEKLVLKWGLLYKKYHLSLIEKELHAGLRSFCNEEILDNLKKEIDKIQKQIKQIELNLFE